MDSIKVVIADDHPVVRSGVETELKKYSDIEVVGSADNGDDALRLVQTIQPDVLVLDINMPGIKTIDLLRHLRSENSPTHVLILTAYGDLEYVLGMLKAGAEGYLLKDENPTNIISGIRAVAEGKVWLSADIARSVVNHVTMETPIATEVLSAREMAVLRLVAQGYSNAQIAQHLVITEGTVKNYVSNLYNKLDVHSRAEAVAWAWQYGILQEAGERKV